MESSPIAPQRNRTHQKHFRKSSVKSTIKIRYIFWFELRQIQNTCLQIIIKVQIKSPHYKDTSMMMTDD